MVENSNRLYTFLLYQEFPDAIKLPVENWNILMINLFVEKITHGYKKNNIQRNVVAIQSIITGEVAPVNNWTTILISQGKHPIIVSITTLAPTLISASNIRTCVSLLLGFDDIASIIVLHNV